GPGWQGRRRGAKGKEAGGAAGRSSLAAVGGRAYAGGGPRLVHGRPAGGRAMTPNGRDIPWLGRDFFENQKNFPLEELAKYQGQYVAWSFDGKSVVMSDSDEAELYRKLDAAGIDSERVVVGWVP